MKNKFTKKEKEFFKPYKWKESKIKLIFTIIASFLFAGVLFDALNGFLILKNAKSISLAIGSIFLLSIFYFVGEAGVEWINSKNNVSSSLCKKIYNFLLLLYFLGLLVIAMNIFYKHLL